MPIITFLSDFGTEDGYVAAMKGVAQSACAVAQLVDATHSIPPQDVRSGAWALRHYWRLYPEGTIHVAVVDPGVGSDRRPLLACADGRWLIGPDNGIFSWVFHAARRWSAWEIAPSVRRPDAVGTTFHGRDVFAFAAGLLASGMPRDQIAPKAVDPVRWLWPSPRRSRTKIAGVIIHVDRFGNAISNIPAPLISRLGAHVKVRCRGFEVTGLAPFYSARNPGEPLALLESTGLLELAICQGNAASKFGLQRGDDVLVQKA
ncbi:MAG: SAM-dependent chlorinase/fluorinase [Kiritimatiellae bacterium]|nr:SAM-dependent chlorinase/fluorinase [Kiritimatiellia bacterium]MDW8457607.1 SAM-dependent chlorinase/fluorinase [Verrucomicrobiota bacterium]